MNLGQGISFRTKSGHTVKILTYQPGCLLLDVSNC